VRADVWIGWAMTLAVAGATAGEVSRITGARREGGLAALSGRLHGGLAQVGHGMPYFPALFSLTWRALP
jgi:hypothetical protein